MLLDLRWRTLARAPAARCGEDEAGPTAPEEVDQRCRPGNVAPHHAKGLAQGSLDRGQPMHDTIALGNSSAARAIHANRVDLIEISHRAIPFGDIANLCDRRDIAIHRIDRLETDQLRTPRIGVDKAALEADRVVMAENLVRAPLCRMPWIIEAWFAA